ncbi:hypothetical protein DSM106972_017000 [Dulcicalothrix desertica PCC 7102]|uniref:Uncharacterized protein n=1 Tax=Dulcicalothrix desertica PCC 7102 TaxID=232991 RepID=A0A433VR76_9CYAN|nr:hypothetical protein [Dulcicalothrix desertica]RUT08532.1 hypothetical protein DSM106972_017000 [Dulcicalothrix desertica PCC 7102]TWH44011.1 hypothetical protein CAL7102_07778 [Dulcicalothrix desertica PCC 7102]
MKNFIPIIASIACSAILTTSMNTVTEATPTGKKKAVQPTTGIVKKLEHGDNACYVTLADNKGKLHNLSADFSICRQEKAYLNKKVRLTYKVSSINSPECQGRVPCNKKQRVNLISNMEVIGAGTKTATLPALGTVKKIINGDLLCYVSIVDDKGKQHELGADFGICGQEKAYLNKRVRLTYGLANVNDCQSAEPCGKTRQEQIIQKMELVRN